VHAAAAEGATDGRSGVEMRLLLLLILVVSARAQDWREALAKTPFSKSSFQAYRTEPVELILKSFKPAGEMRGVILMPSAADQLYFFDWGKIELGASPSLLDALNALTNKTQALYSFVSPFLLIHMPRDTTSDPLTMADDAPQKISKRKKKGRVQVLDRPYNRVLPALKDLTGLNYVPDQRDPASWHYYRLSFVGHDLTAPELLRAIAYGTKTSVRVEKKRVVFQERPFNP
jgi:hypothetical protein